MIKLVRLLLKRNKPLYVRRFALSENGFTLAEMIIVIAIVGIFSTLTVVNFRGNEKARYMDNESRLILDGINKCKLHLCLVKW